MLGAWAMDVVVGSEATSAMRSASCEAALGCPWLGQPVWSGCCSVVGWTKCFSGNILAHPAPDSSSGVRTVLRCPIS